MPIGMQPSMAPRVERLIINLDTAMALLCGWDECDRRARTPYQIRVHEHPGHWPCQAGRHSHYAFCCDRHKAYWLNASGWRANVLAERYGGRIYGMLPPGERVRA